MIKWIYVLVAIRDGDNCSVSSEIIAAETEVGQRWALRQNSCKPTCSFIFEMKEQAGLQVCWRSAERWLTSIRATMRLEPMEQGGLQECYRSLRIFASRSSPKSALLTPHTYITAN